MNTPTLMQRIVRLALILMVGASMNAEAGLFGFGGDSWKEEVLLHDGQKIIVSRSQTYGGQHEFGKPSPIKEHTISFTPPNSNKNITWTSEYGEDIGRTNFNVLALHVLGNTPYLVVSPNLCLSYNKWGRPNPPYVIFKHDGKDWRRIQLEELPAEFKTINVALDIQGREVEELNKLGFVSVEQIAKLNAHIKRAEFRAILREPLSEKNVDEGCMKLVRTGDGWKSLDWFTSQNSLNACLKFCERESVAAQNCPCTNLFKGK